MKLIPLLCIVFIKASEGCNHQNDEKLSKFHTLIRGNEISIQSTGSSQERWHIIRDSICKAKLTCKNFYIPPSEDCLKSSLEVIDGDLIKLRFCGYSSILGEYFLFRGHPYITSANRLGGWVQKMAFYADVHYCIYADKVGGVHKGKKYAAVIQGWPLTKVGKGK